VNGFTPFLFFFTYPTTRTTQAERRAALIPEKASREKIPGAQTRSQSLTRTRPKRASAALETAVLHL